MYEMLTGLPPWYTPDRKKLFHRICCAELHFPAYVSFPAECLIRGLLNRNPAKRLGIKGLSSFQRHPFFKGLRWDKVLAKQLQPPIQPCATQRQTTASHVQRPVKEALTSPSPAATALASSTALTTSAASSISIHADKTALHSMTGKAVDGEENEPNRPNVDVQALESVANFDKAFTQLPLPTEEKESFPWQETFTSTESTRDLFNGFTYENPEYLKA